MSLVQESTPAEGSLQPTTNPAEAQGAQIPLQNFTLPTFPPEAQGLKALTLTSDIKLDEYQNLLKDYATIPKLPISIESLTLELFSLGYPPGFLSALSQQLPNIKSLVIYSQLFPGITEESTKDAEHFFENLTGLRALHLLDVFAKPHFFNNVGTKIAAREKGLMFLEVNYSFRHEDEDFLTRVPATELAAFISPSLITCALNISAPDVTDDPDDPTNQPRESDKEGEQEQLAKEGVMSFNKTLSPALVKALTDETTRPGHLRVLNTTLFTITPQELKTILKEHKYLSVLSATVEVEPTRECSQTIMEALKQCPTLEQCEIVGNPSLQFFMAVSNPRSQALENAFPGADDLEKVGEVCPKFTSFKANILRTTTMGSVSWLKYNNEWRGGIVRPGEEKK